ncbi:hypothetical protein [Streptomyces sp. NPDC047028]|uniref:hypothetical protein n=1 Tax=Streptomyces sp. NPDC047028 TaxID=3155793 RepID=UPI0033E42AFE
MNTERPENAEEPETPEGAREDEASGAADDGTPEADGTAGERDTAGAKDAAGGKDTAGQVHEIGGVDGAGDTPAPPGRRRTPVVVASVVAAVLLVGGGGAYLATSGGSGGRTAPGAAGGHGTPPPLALDGRPGGTAGIAPGEPNPYGVTYVARGELPDGPGSAAVYAPKGEVGRDAVARLARALGVQDVPVLDGRIWRVGGGKDGFGPSLQVNRDAPGSWTFSRYAPGTDNCKKLICGQDPGGPAGSPVSEAAAKKAAAPVLKALGQDDAKVDAGQIMGAQRVVNADPVVGGLPTYGWTTGLTISKQGELVGGHGLLAAPAKGPLYPVLSAEKTLALLNGAPKSDHRMGIGGCTSPVPPKDRLEKPCPRPTAVPSESAGNTVPVEKAVFGLAAHSVAGKQTLVPSWLFELGGSAADGAGTVSYPAVDPTYLASPTAPAAPTAPSAARKTHDVKVEGYLADGRNLTVSFMGGVCADYRASAKEGADAVTVTVTETPWPDKVCVMIAKEYTKTVRLDAPLDGRKVLGTDGRRLPQVKPGALRPQQHPGPVR